MSEDEKLRFILIMSAVVAALAVHRFLETSQAVCPSINGRALLCAQWVRLRLGLTALTAAGCGQA